ncbi:MAG TPA: hypothetical protein PK037_07800 [Saprospiraceae bacterium]|jgi:hypothetical protein|nr:hypothetical protein [Saprospiraceae bacterium]
MQIKSVRKGHGDKSILFKVGLFGICRIVEELKEYVFFHEKTAKIVVYRCYDPANKLLYEVEAGDGLIVTYV